MDNIKDKDFQVRDDAFTNDLCEALRRRETKRSQVEVPNDFLDSVMQQVEAENPPAKAKAWRIALASLAIAACTLTAVLLIGSRLRLSESRVEFAPSLPSVSRLDQRSKEEGQKSVGSKLIVYKEQIHHQPSSDIYPASIVTTPAPKKVHKVKAKKQVSQKETPPTENVNESDNYMAELEKGLADVRDSCYLAQVERMILDNEELQRLMNEMTNQKQ